MLASLDAIRSILACPRCQGPLSGPVQRLRCDDPACGLTPAGQPFPLVGRWPVLVDFEQTILDRQQLLATGARTLVPRTEGWMQQLRRVLFEREGHQTPRMQRFRALLDGVERPLILVIGGGTVGRMVMPLYEHAETLVVGFDVYASVNTQFIADAHQIPLASDSVDAAIIVAVLEHVVDPWKVAEEIHRVLRPRGVVFAESPFMQQVHEGPYDFTRFTDSGHRYLFRRFEHVASGVSGGLGTQLAWSIERYVGALTRSSLASKATRLLFYWLHLTDGWIPESYALDGASALYFLGLKSNRTLTPRELVTYYRGAQR